MRTSDFDYELPKELIAQTPIEPRDASRLLVVSRRDGTIQHRHFRDIGEFLHPGDLLIANQSRVLRARLFGRKIPTGGRVEMLLLRKLAERRWEVLLKPGRRVHPGARIGIEPQSQSVDDAHRVELEAEVVERTETGGRIVQFSLPVEPLLDRIGIIPLPPYIHVPLADPERYQTVYAQTTGSVAAPTAGLHFTPELMRALQAQGTAFAFVTLHVSMDTFRPVQTEEIEAHQMFTEYCELSSRTAEAMQAARTAGGRAIAVGTTAVRTIESAALRAGSGTAIVPAFSGKTDLFIYPGFRFRAVQAMITNFHLPRSSLLMLVAAFTGKDLLDHAYREAIRERYRFYSFGDAMLIL